MVDLPSYEESVKVYQNLCRLRYLRDVALQKQAQEMRKKNEFGHIWYSAQYRPTYTQEAVADLREALSKSAGNGTVHWEDPWRMGDVNKYWSPVLPELKHTVMDRLGNTAREESALLKELGAKAKQEFSKLRQQEQSAQDITL